MTTTKPATPLPYSHELDMLHPRGNQWVISVVDEHRALKSTVAKLNTNLIAPEHGDAEQHAAYIVHACNAYPELVAALRNMQANAHLGVCNSLNKEVQALHSLHEDQIIALLAKLGEVR